jgi:hypothetical protein
MGVFGVQLISDGATEGGIGRERRALRRSLAGVSMAQRRKEVVR